jgi:hypothetical protein
MDEIYNIMKYWREVYSDGNTFYRIVMYKLLENYILKNDIESLKVLFSNIMNENNQKFYIDNDINSEFVFGTFELIYNYMKRGNILKAYKILNASYKLLERDFDKLLICYLKNVVYKYMSEFYTEIYKNPSEEEKINLEKIKIFNLEPEFIIICLIPFLFQVKLTLFYLDGSYTQPVFSPLNFITDEEENNSCDMPIGIFYNTFFPLYGKNDFAGNKTFENVIQRKPIRIKQLTFVSNDTIQCEKCKQEQNIIYFLQKKFKVCYECLKNCLNNKIKKRANAIKKEKFSNIEYYLRDIELERNFTVNDFEFIEIFEEKNIYNAIIEECPQLSNCIECNKNFPDGNLFKLKCGCVYCNECLDIKIDEASEGKKILCKFEKKKVKKIDCKCGRIFDLDDAVNVFKEKIDKKYFDNCKKRLEHYVEIHCMICSKQLFKEEKKKGEKSVFVQNTNFKTVDIKKENNEGIEFVNKPHKICIDCFNKEFKKIQNEKKEDKKKEDKKKDDKKKDDKKKENNKKEEEDVKEDDLNYKKVKCKICEKNQYIKLGEDGGCCAGCILF